MQISSLALVPLCTRLAGTYLQFAIIPMILPVRKHNRTFSMMMCFRIIFVVIGLLWPIFTQAQVIEWVTIGGNVHAFHEDVFRGQKIGLEQFVVSDVTTLVELIGIPNAAKINALHLQIRRSAGLRNAMGYTGQGYRTLVFDPVWAANAPNDFYLVLGHEAGHFFCGHDDLPQSPKIELEADRFAGASIKRLEAMVNRQHFAAVLAAAARRYPEKASAFYPARAERLAALRAGYEQGSPCGALAPVSRTSR